MGCWSSSRGCCSGAGGHHGLRPAWPLPIRAAPDRASSGASVDPRLPLASFIENTLTRLECMKQTRQKEQLG